MKIGILDSGLGGLSVLHRAMLRFPGAEYLYYADRAHVPYGEKTPEEVMGYVRDALRFLEKQGAEAFVIACNTATSVAAGQMRQEFSQPIIGMEPAIKLALDRYPAGRVLAAATPITVRGEKMHALLDRWDGAHRSDLLALPELVRFAEREEFSGEAVTTYLREQLRPYELQNYCAFVLGCTHFNYFKDSLRQLLPDGVHILDGVDGTLSRLAACVAIPENVSIVAPQFFDSGEIMSPPQRAEVETCLRRLDAMAEIE